MAAIMIVLRDKPWALDGILDLCGFLFLLLCSRHSWCLWRLSGLRLPRSCRYRRLCCGCGCWRSHLGYACHTGATLLASAPFSILDFRPDSFCVALRGALSSLGCASADCWREYVPHVPCENHDENNKNNKDDDGYNYRV